MHYRAWLQAAFGYDEDTVGSHAGITDTSQMLFIRPTGVRKDQIKPWGGPQDSGVSGDPAKATAEIGKMGIEFKVNAGHQSVQAAEESAAAAPRHAPGVQTSSHRDTETRRRPFLKIPEPLSGTGVSKNCLLCVFVSPWPFSDHQVQLPDGGGHRPSNCRNTTTCPR